MNGYGYDRESRRPQHHHWLGRAAFAPGEFCKKLGMSGMPKTGAVQYVLCNRIGDDRTGSPGDGISDRLTN